MKIQAIGQILIALISPTLLLNDIKTCALLKNSQGCSFPSVFLAGTQQQFLKTSSFLQHYFATLLFCYRLPKSLKSEDFFKTTEFCSTTLNKPENKQKKVKSQVARKVRVFFQKESPSAWTWTLLMKLSLWEAALTIYKTWYNGSKRGPQSTLRGLVLQEHTDLAGQGRS